MDFPDFPGALLGAFLQHIGSALWCAQTPEFAQVVGPLHIEGQLLLGPFSCLPKLIIHELTSCFWILWLAGWWWEDLVSNNSECFFFVWFVSGTEIWSFFSFSRPRQWVEQFHKVGMCCGDRFCYFMQIWSIMGRSRSNSFAWRILSPLYFLDFEV